MKLQLTFCAVLGVVTAASAARATDLNAALTVDDAFSFYISTDDTAQGTFVGSGTSWPTVGLFSQALTPGVTNYLHVVGVDNANPAMFIGQFTLSDTNFAFGNGTQQLLTDPAFWSVSTTGFGSNYATPVDLGPDGTGPWGNLPNINDNARFIWANEDIVGKSEFFSAAIYANEIEPPGPVETPEPASLGVLAIGCGALLLKRRKTA